MNPPNTETERSLRPPSPHIADHHWAWFLDVDGTLLEIEQHPDLVSADNRLLQLLDRLAVVYDGAVALISGRSLEQLDRIFDSHEIAAAASHGLELRPRSGDVTQLGRTLPDAVAAQVTMLAERHEGLVLERKTFSIGLHYRNRPELAGEITRALENIVSGLDNGYRLQHGKMIVELLPAAANKGDAIRTFMQHPPFSGRRPVFVGDDVTDEHGFAVVNGLEGFSIRIGDGNETAARWRLRNVAELRTWLQTAINLV